MRDTNGNSDYGEPTMSYVGTTFPAGWLVLPMLGISVIRPVGN